MLRTKIPFSNNLWLHVYTKHFCASQSCSLSFCPALHHICLSQSGRSDWTFTDFKIKIWLFILRVFIFILLLHFLIERQMNIIRRQSLCVMGHCPWPLCANCIASTALESGTRGGTNDGRRSNWRNLQVCARSHSLQSNAGKNGWCATHRWSCIPPFGRWGFGRRQFTIQEKCGLRVIIAILAGFHADRSNSLHFCMQQLRSHIVVATVNHLLQWQKMGSNETKPFLQNISIYIDIFICI